MVIFPLDLGIVFLDTVRPFPLLWASAASSGKEEYGPNSAYIHGLRLLFVSILLGNAELDGCVCLH